MRCPPTLASALQLISKMELLAPPQLHWRHQTLIPLLDYVVVSVWELI